MTNMLYAGQPVLRFEDDRLLRGKGAYVADLDDPGALHATIVRSPHHTIACVLVTTGMPVSASMAPMLLTTGKRAHGMYMASASGAAWATSTASS